MILSLGVHAQVLEPDKETKITLNDTTKSANPLKQLLKKSTAEKLLLDSNKKTSNGGVIANAAITKENAVGIKEKEQPKAQLNLNREELSPLIRAKNQKNKIDSLQKML